MQSEHYLRCNVPDTLRGILQHLLDGLFINVNVESCILPPHTHTVINGIQIPSGDAHVIQRLPLLQGKER